MHNHNEKKKKKNQTKKPKSKSKHKTKSQWKSKTKSLLQQPNNWKKPKKYVYKSFKKKTRRESKIVK